MSGDATDYGSINVPETPTTDEEIAKLPVLDLDKYKADPLDALEEKWRTEPADPAEWAMRATRTLNLARMWKRNALEWEQVARKNMHDPEGERRRR